MKGHDSIIPVFIHIDFTSHSDAWKAYEALSRGMTNGLPINVTWIKTNWYRRVAEKDKLWRFRTPDLISLAESQEDQFQKSLSEII